MTPPVLLKPNGADLTREYPPKFPRLKPRTRVLFRLAVHSCASFDAHNGGVPVHQAIGVTS
jgi:hypothetical protein